MYVCPKDASSTTSKAQDTIDFEDVEVEALVPPGGGSSRQPKQESPPITGNYTSIVVVVYLVTSVGTGDG
mgnify:CR=1 FL=1